MVVTAVALLCAQILGIKQGAADHARAAATDAVGKLNSLLHQLLAHVHAEKAAAGATVPMDDAGQLLTTQEENVAAAGEPQQGGSAAPAEG